jgi:signal transduction histidine kinase
VAGRACAGPGAPVDPFPVSAFANLRRRLTPLDISAYITWVGVSMDLMRLSARFAPVGSVPARDVVAALLLAFLVAFVVASRADRRQTRLIDYWPLAVMLASTFGVIALGPSNTAPVLLIVVAVVAVLEMNIIAATALMLAANVALAGILASVWQTGQTARVLLTFGGFQLFAGIASHAMRRARESAEALREVNAHLLATQSLLAESAREGERLRLSRELHDVSGHKLTALKLNLAVLGRDSELASRRELQTARGLADELLQDIRGVVAQLRSHDGIDLREAFARLAETLPAPRVHVEVAEDALVDDTARAETLVRMAQEGLTNSARHSGAQNVWLKLTREADGVELVVEDDGHVRGPLTPGHGLTGMRERIAALGGELLTESARGGGLRLRARLPRERAV